MEKDCVVQLKYDFELTEIGGETIAIVLGEGADDFHGMIKLDNDSAIFMFKKLQMGITPAELIRSCVDHYENCTEQEAEPVVMAFLDQLAEKSLIVAEADQVE